MKKIVWIILSYILVSFFTLSRVSALEPLLDRPLEIEVLANGELLVTDGGGRDWTNEGSEVFIFDRDGEIKWHYTDALVFAHSAHLFSDQTIVITDTTNDRIIAVDRETQQVVWSSDDWDGGTGELSDGSRLDYPNEALETTGGNILVTDRNNDRILELDQTGKILWESGKLSRPHNASKIDNEQYLVSDSENNRVVLLNRRGEILWEFSGGEDKLNWPRDVKLLNNGNFLITDTRNHRVLEATRAKTVVWEYTEGLYWPYEAERLANGNTLISDSQNRRLVEVNPTGQIVWDLSLSAAEEFGKFANGGFEQLVNAAPEGWIKADLLAEGTGEFSIDQTVRHSGKSSGKLDYAGRGYIFWLQKVRVQPGIHYSFSGWVKTNLESTGASWSRYELWWENEQGSFIDPPMISSKSTGKADWGEREWSGKAPAGAIAVNIRAVMTGTGRSWFDDVSWKKSSNKNWLYLIFGFVAVIVGRWLWMLKSKKSKYAN